MSVDVIYNAVFPEPKGAAQRFAELLALLANRREFKGPGRVSVYELIGSGDRLVNEVNPSAARLKSLLVEYDDAKYGISGTWGVHGTRDGVRTLYGVEVSCGSPLSRSRPWLDRDVDLVWDLGNVRRYTEGDPEQPNHEQLISDLQVLVELGASSIWGARDYVVNPDNLYAMYHRNPNDYRADGLETPLPKWPIGVEHIEVAAESAREKYEADDGLRLFTTAAGPIVYSPLLARGTLNMFYTYLERMMQAEVRADIEQTRASGYQTHEYTEGENKWLVVERRSDGAEIVRVDALEREGDVLTVAYEIIEPGINDIIIRELIPLAVLDSFYGGSYRRSVSQLRYRDKLNKTEDLVPYDG